MLELDDLSYDAQAQLVQDMSDADWKLSGNSGEPPQQPWHTGEGWSDLSDAYLARAAAIGEGYEGATEPVTYDDHAKKIAVVAAGHWHKRERLNNRYAEDDDLEERTNRLRASTAYEIAVLDWKRDGSNGFGPELVRTDDNAFELKVFQYEKRSDAAFADFG